MLVIYQEPTRNYSKLKKL